MIIPLINPQPARRVIARKVARHLRRDIAHYRHEIKEHGRLVRGLRLINPDRPPKRWFDEKFAEKKSEGYKDPARIVGHLWHHKISPEKKREILHRYERNSSPAFRRRPASRSRLQRGLRGTSTSLKERRMAVYTMRPRRKRRATRRRHNPRFGLHRPTLLFGVGGWRRRKHSRLFRHATRINPRKRRHGRHFRHNDPRRSFSFRRYRRNPALVPSITNAAMGGLKIAAGIAVGLYGKSALVRFMPANITGSFGRFYGVIHIAAGGATAALVKNALVRDIALVVAGTGVYDLIATNLSFLGLPPLSSSIALPGVSAAPALPAAGASYQGADMAPAIMGASYNGDDIAYGGSDVEIE